MAKLKPYNKYLQAVYSILSFEMRRGQGVAEPVWTVQIVHINAIFSLQCTYGALPDGCSAGQICHGISELSPPPSGFTIVERDVSQYGWKDADRDVPC
jgi:hypothetical protein